MVQPHTLVHSTSTLSRVGTHASNTFLKIQVELNLPCENKEKIVLTNEYLWNRAIKSHFSPFCWLVSVAGTVIQANGRPDFEDGSRTGVLLHCVTRWTSVRTKLCVNMDTLGEPRVPRLSKEVRNGPEETSSSSKYPRWAVVGLRRWVCKV